MKVILGEGCFSKSQLHDTHNKSMTLDPFSPKKSWCVLLFAEQLSIYGELISLQSLGNITNVLLVNLWLNWLRQLRTDRHQRIHPFFRSTHVWHVLSHQHNRSAQFAHCHDEPFVPAHLCKLSKFGSWTKKWHPMSRWGEKDVRS